MSLPFTSLDAATSPGPGEVRDLEGSVGPHTMIVSTTGSPSGGSTSVSLEGSHDGVIWAGLANSPVGSNIVDLHSEALVRYVRANLSSLSGGTDPTVTATIASGESDS